MLPSVDPWDVSTIEEIRNFVAARLQDVELQKLPFSAIHLQWKKCNVIYNVPGVLPGERLMNARSPVGYDSGKSIAVLSEQKIHPLLRE